MKKILSVLSTIFIFTIITNIIACNIPNTNNKNNKPTEFKFTPQQPPTNSNWKLVNTSSSQEIRKETFPINNKWYIIIYGDSNKLIQKTKNDKNGKILITISGLYTGIIFDNINYFNIKNIIIYCWNGVGEPQIPIINTKTGEIENWNEKI